MRLNVFNLVNNKEQAQPWRSGVCFLHCLLSLSVSGVMGCAFPGVTWQWRSVICIPSVSLSYPV